MKAFVVLALIITLFINPSTADFLNGTIITSSPGKFEKCKGIAGNEYFDLSGFAKPGVSDIVTQDILNGSIFIHPCQAVNITNDTTLAASCSSLPGYSAYYVDSDGNCTQMSPIFNTSDVNYQVEEILTQQISDKNDTTTTIQGTQMIYSTSLYYNETANYTLNLRLVCNDSKYASDFVPVNDYTDDSMIYIEGYSAEACYVYSGEQLFYFIGEYEWLFITIGAILGVGVCFFGFILWKPTLFLVGTVGAGGALFMLLFLFCLPDAPRQWLYWTYLALSIVVGLVIGFIVKSFEKAGVCIAGGVLGFFTATFLEGLIFSHIHTSNPNVIFYSVAAGLVVVGMVLAFFLHDHILIMSTAFCGSFSAIYCLGSVIGGFPNIYTLSSDIINGQLNAVPWTIYLYLSGILVMCVLGMFVQYKHRARKLRQKHDHQPNLEQYYKS